MLRGLFGSGLRKELEEIRHKHRLEMEEVAERTKRERSHWEEDRARHIKQLTDDHEIKLREAVTLAKLNSDQQIKQAELNAERRFNEKCEALNKEHYDKLSAAMTKLHEEGNVTTKFTQEMALQMMKSLPTNKSETKVLTGSIDVTGEKMP